MSTEHQLTKSKTLKLLSELDKLSLPKNEYVITGSGPLSIRGIRMMSDIDLGVTKVLWNKLSKVYPILVEGGVRKIRLANNIELFCDDSFADPIPGAPTITEQVSQSETIEGYPFQSINHLKWFKQSSGREKDLKDIELLKGYESDRDN